MGVVCIWWGCSSHQSLLLQQSLYRLCPALVVDAGASLALLLNRRAAQSYLGRWLPCSFPSMAKAAQEM